MLSKEEIKRQYTEGVISETQYYDMLFQFEEGDYAE